MARLKTPPRATTPGGVFLDLADPPEAKYKKDPSLWARERMGIHLWSKQCEIIESVRDHPQTTVHSCHQIGKSFIAAQTVCWWLDVHPPGTAFVVTTAPTGPQVEAILWREINRAHQRAGLRGRTNLTEWYMGKEMVAYGRKPSDYNPHAFQGVHALYFLVVLDEACGIPRNLWDSAATLAANVHSRTLAIGNPDDPNGEFAANCKSPDWNTIGIGYAATPNFTGEQVPREVSESLISPGWVEGRRRKWGEDSAIFQSKCLGQFPTVGDPFTTIPYAWANACRYNELPAVGPIEAGIDVGGGGDRTVVFVRQGPKVIAMKEFRSSDPMASVGEILLFIQQHNVEVAKVDTIGIGWGIYGRLRELSRKHSPHMVNQPEWEVMHDSEVLAVNFGSSLPDGLSKKFLNLRAYAYWQVGRENSRLKLWDLSFVDDDTIHELTVGKYKIMDSWGKIKIQPKDEIIKELGFSPDMADALVMTFIDRRYLSKAPQGGALGQDLTARVRPTDAVERSREERITQAPTRALGKSLLPR